MERVRLNTHHYLKHVIKEEEDGLEVFYFMRTMWGLTTKKIRSVKFIDYGILLDGERVTVRKRVSPGQLLMVLLDDTEEREDRVLPCPMPLDILYEDENLIFLNKPSGMVSHPSKGHLTDSLANGVKAHFEDNADCYARVHLIGRLDKDTSGIVGIAKNGVTGDRMHQLRKLQKLQKEYLAIIEGTPQVQEDQISIPMEEYHDPEDYDRIKMISAGSGGPWKAASTHYRLVKSYGDYSLIRVRIETGRTHQIRFHMAEIGHPLLGDPIYGRGAYEYEGGVLSRTALHAACLLCPHPFDHKIIELKAELPADMKTLLGREDGEANYNDNFVTK